MNTIRALVLNEYGDQNATQIGHIAAPTAGAGQVLVRVRAAGINALDWKVREGYVRDAFPLQLPTVLGIELAGVVEAVGPDVTHLRQGDRVMGALGDLGAYAELVAVNAANLIKTPDALSDVDAAALPVATVSAWQSLHHAGPLHAGQRILIHGAAGGLGGFAVQYAHRAGAVVYATTRSSQVATVQRLGADHVVAYDQAQFENTMRDIDLVLDYVGGEVLDRSWRVLAQDGAIVSTASPAIVASTPPGRRGLWFINTPDSALLQQLADDVAQQRVQSRIGAVVPFADLPAAIERNRTQPQPGKSLVDFSL
ncbi:NADP-dependent oxidoreductase [Amantichitinum ursilacus]|uniref:Erythronolide synthase, modules 3 and 4 n=1 Tax=Amantichitinum ursilacus TaxID=857265 RepID=A0A0N1JU30_9NEIS|nr:NADP-dependent oxidoreductase [Amantichitinum ursilacus]KPC55195.1 Erythronolide synthase, modules 3 and 4 [Amantichitinum ursilacus]